MPTNNNNTTGWVGWVYFAGLLMLVRAVFQGFFGVVALAKDDFYVVTAQHLAVFNYSAWGWVHIALSVVLLTAGLSVINGGMWGRVIGSLVTALALLANLIFLPAYPLWCIAAIIIDALILYALVVHGNEARN